MKNKLISVLLISIFIIGLLTGCGKTTNTAKDNATVTSSAFSVPEGQCAFHPDYL
jgi:hypothetical protein